MKNEIKMVSAEDAVSHVKSGDRVHFSGIAGYPQKLSEALYQRGLRGEIEDVTVQYMHNISRSPFAGKETDGIFNLEVVYTGANIRKEVQAGYADYIPVHLSDTADMIRSGAIDVDVAMIMVSPPDKHGYVSLGTSVDINLPNIENAKLVVAAINPNVPRTFGDAMIPADSIDLFCEDNSPIIELPTTVPSKEDNIIAGYCAELIEDGATLQMGIGNLPNVLLSKLSNHKGLGLHTEMFSDGVLPLYQSGVIDNRNKNIDRGKIVASFLMGTKALYDFADDNPGIIMKTAEYTNNPSIISRNPKVTAINAAISIDLTGQICADSIGTLQISGSGGQLDFVRGANMSTGGKSIITISSTTKKGGSKIVPTLLEGSGVVTPRADARYIITEFGVADLFGKPLQKRARALIDIAHPEHREMLEEAAFKRFGPRFLKIK